MRIPIDLSAWRYLYDTHAMQRRELLSGLATGGALALSGCSGLLNRNPLEVNIYQTTQLTTYAGVSEDDAYRASNVARTWIEHALQPLIHVSSYTHLDITVIREPVDLDFHGAKAIIRELEWDEHVDSTEKAEHANLLLDTGPSQTRSRLLGIALQMSNQGTCEHGSDESNSSLVQYADALLEVDPTQTPEPIQLIKDKSPHVGVYPELIAISTAHEVGHNICAKHINGNAWRGNDVPEHLVKNPTSNTVYSSLMMLEYVMDLGGRTNTCGEEIEVFRYDEPERARTIEYFDDLTVLPRLSRCAISHMVEMTDH